MSHLQAYKNGLQGLSASYVGTVRVTDVSMADNGGGPRTLTTYTGNTAGNASSLLKLAGGNVEFGMVRALLSEAAAGIDGLQCHAYRTNLAVHVSAPGRKRVTVFSLAIPTMATNTGGLV